MTQAQKISKTIAKSAVRTLDQFGNDLEQAVSHHMDKACKDFPLTGPQANAFFYYTLEVAQNLSFEECAIYVKEVSEDTEKWFDPRNQKTYFVTNRDFSNRY